MQSEGRRAFLMGRRPASSPWEHFCGRLRRVAAGELTVLDDAEDGQAARLLLRQPADVHHARSLCREFGICMALDGVPHPAPHPGPVLWLRPGRELAACRRLEPEGSRWFVQPGCLLGELEAAGLACFADMPAHLTVAAWLADRTLCDWPAGETSASGVVHASALLSDGISVSLGAFAADNRKPLDTLRLQKLIPELFRLAFSADGEACRGRGGWPARYRLDALRPAPGHVLNLAHLLLGHGGDLAWVEWVVIDTALAHPRAGAARRAGGVPADPAGSAGAADGADPMAEDGLDGVDRTRAAQELDAALKALFDPHDLFPHPGQAFQP